MGEWGGSLGAILFLLIFRLDITIVTEQQVFTFVTVLTFVNVWGPSNVKTVINMKNSQM